MNNRNHRTVHLTAENALVGKIEGSTATFTDVVITGTLSGGGVGGGGVTGASGGGETLAETLALGNATGANDLQVDRELDFRDGASITGYDSFLYPGSAYVPSSAHIIPTVIGNSGAGTDVATEVSLTSAEFHAGGGVLFDVPVTRHATVFCNSTLSASEAQTVRDNFGLYSVLWFGPSYSGATTLDVIPYPHGYPHSHTVYNTSKTVTVINQSGGNITLNFGGAGGITLLNGASGTSFVIADDTAQRFCYMELYNRATSSLQTFFIPI